MSNTDKFHFTAQEPMPTAEIITIGTELLLGEIVDSNTQYLAQELKNLGIDIHRTTTIGDNIQRIQSIIIESFNRVDILITTGGLGPTENDLTRQAVAQAFNRELQFHPKLWSQIETRFQRVNRIASENNRRQAFLPKGAIAIKNPVGTAPGFYIKNNSHLLICLPGVPAEMKYLFKHKVVPILNRNYPSNQVIYSKVIHTVGIGESKIDSLISELEMQSNPTVGLSAHPGQVDIRLTVKAANPQQAEKILQPIINQISKSLGKGIFGMDAVKLNDIVINKIKKGHYKIIILTTSNAISYIKTLQNQLNLDNSEVIVQNRFAKVNYSEYLNNDPNTRLLQLKLKTEKEKKSLQITLISPHEKKQEVFFNASHPNLFSEWVNNMVLDFLRIHLI